MADASDIEDALIENVQGPKSVTNAAGERVEAQDPLALLEVLKQVAGSAAVAASPSSGLKFTKFKHRGTQG